MKGWNWSWQKIFTNSEWWLSTFRRRRRWGWARRGRGWRGRWVISKKFPLPPQHGVEIRFNLDYLKNPTIPLQATMERAARSRTKSASSTSTVSHTSVLSHQPTFFKTSKTSFLFVVIHYLYSIHFSWCFATNYYIDRRDESSDWNLHSNQLHPWQRLNDVLLKFRPTEYNLCHDILNSLKQANFDPVPLNHSALWRGNLFTICCRIINAVCCLKYFAVFFPLSKSSTSVRVLRAALRSHL